jgi:predicted nucleotidyltransferase
MNTPAQINRIRLRAVAQMMSGLGQEIAFVGGATIALYVHSPTAADVRPTDDIDVVVELASYGSYSNLDARLRQLGFQNDVMSGVICRYRVQGIIVDVMPTDPTVLGFSNRWYPDGFRNAMNYQLDEQTSIRLFTLPYFIASKWEACKGRGGEDLRLSTDFEDIIFVLDQVSDAEAQLLQAPEAVRTYFREEFEPVLRRPDRDECIYVHLEPRFATVRTQRIVQLLTNVISY